MNNINTFAIEGRLVADPEHRVTTSGVSIGTCTIANERGFGDREKTNFFDVKIFGKSAEAFCKYAEKGQQVVFCGELDQERWEGNDGQKRSKVVLKAWDWTLGRKPRQKDDTAQPRDPQPVQQNLDGSLDEEEDVPF
jgi:single-strand DNA-binding protein